MISRRDAVKLGAVGSLVGTTVFVDRGTSSATAEKFAFANQTPLGELRWSFNHAGTGDYFVNDISSQRVSISNVGYLLKSKDELALVDHETLEIKWRQSYAGEIEFVWPLQNFENSPSRLLELQLASFETIYVDTNSGEVLWSEQGRGDGGITYGDLLISTVGRMGYYGVAVKNLHDGSVRWIAEATWDGVGKIAEIHEHGIACALNDVVTMHDLKSGDAQWTSSLEDLIRHYQTDDGVLLLSSSKVTLLDSKSGKTVWQLPLAGKKNVIVNKPGLVAIQGDHLVTAISTDQGNILWQAPNDYDNMFSYVTEHHRVLEIRFDNYDSLYCSAVTGELLFHKDSSTTFRSSPNFYLLIKETTAHLIDTNSATIEFLTELAEPQYSISLIELSDTHLVYVVPGADSIYIHRVDLASGEDTLALTLSEDFALLFGDTVVAGGNTPTIYSLRTGEMWAQPDMARWEIAPRSHGNMLYLADNTTLVGLNMEKEEIVFSRSLPGLPIDFLVNKSFGIAGGTTLWYRTDSVSDKYTIHAVDKDGKEAWSFGPLSENFDYIVHTYEDSVELWLFDEAATHVISSTTGEVRLKFPLPISKNFDYIVHRYEDSVELWLFDEDAIHVISSTTGEVRLKFPLPNAYRSQIQHTEIRGDAVLIKDSYDSLMYSV